MIICGTGHRPNKLGGYGELANNKRYMLAHIWLETNKPNLVISGMALGWDQALAHAAWNIGIPFHAYVPFSGQKTMWPSDSKNEWTQLINVAAEIKLCCEGGYAAWKMQKRNEDMVNASDQVLALFDGSPGGTANCINYATIQKKPIINLWSEWMKLQ